MRIVHFFYSHIFISQILYNICNVKYEIFFAADLWKFQSVPEPAPLQGGFGGGGALQDAAAEGAAATSAGDKLSNLEKKIWKNWGKNLEKQYRSDVGWAKSRFTLLKANKSQPNRAKKIGYISNERPDLGVFIRYLVSSDEKQFYCSNITSFKCCPLLSKQWTAILFITFSSIFPN